MIQINTAMNKFHILVIVIFGLFLMPTATFACGSHSNKNSCNKETAANTEKMDCCKNDNHSKNKSCNGKCGHSNCVRSTTTSFSVVFSEVKFQTNNFDFSEKEQNYFNSEANLSSGFSSLWLIPKIG